MTDPPPLLFAEADNNKSKKSKARRRQVQPDAATTTTACKELYPMYLMSLPELLKLDHLVPHQELLRRGALVKYDPEKHEGRVIFMSHQWAGYDHPDPSDDQLKCLQRVLQRMVDGEISSIQTNWRQALVFEDNFCITAKDMQSAVPHMMVWLDYVSMPQPTAGPMPEQAGAETKIAGDDADDDHGGKEDDEPETDADAAGADSAATLPSGTTDHRSDEGLGALLNAAVESIPAYVEQATLMIILTPPHEHHDRKGEIVSLQSWRSRGWCRLEFMAANLSRRQLRVMTVQGPEAQPEFVFPADALFLAVGEGDFTCCARNHDFGDGPDSAPCDKIKVAAVLDVMLRAKIDHLFKQGRWFEARYYVALTPYITRGMETHMEAIRAARRADEESQAGSSWSDRSGRRRGSVIDKASFLLKATSGGAGDETRLPPDDKGGSVNPVAALQARLRWRRGPGGNEDGTKEEKEWCKETGTSLLWWAATCNDVAAVKVLLGEGGGDAGASASSVGGASLSRPASASVVDDAGGRRRTNEKSIRKELKRGLRRAWPALTLFAGLTPLHMAMVFASPAVVEALLDAGAAPTARTGGPGFDPLHVAATFGAVENIEAWLRRFPSWDLERRDKLTGNTALLYGAATGAGRSLAVTKTLLEAGARADAVSHFGANLLNMAAANPDMKPNDFRTLLALPQVRGLVDDLLNMPMVPRTCKWKLIFKVSGSRTVARGRAVRRHCLWGGGVRTCVRGSVVERRTDARETHKEGSRRKELFSNLGPAQGVAVPACVAAVLLFWPPRPPFLV